MKLMSIVTPCYNEEGNVEELYKKIKDVASSLENYRYEHIYIDNASTDGTQEIIKAIAAQDSHVRLIINNRNFGHIRSPVHGMLQAHGDAVIIMASDLQDPPSLIPQFVQKWEEGFCVVVGQKAQSEESSLFFFARCCYYRLVNRLAEVELLENVTGFGLYDQKVIQMFREIDDPYPYVRGLISELGYPVERIVYTQPKRKRGFTKNNFYTLFDMAMLGLTSHSKVPLRIATMMGFTLSFFSFVIAVGYLIAKIFFWRSFEFGLAPIIIGLFLFSSVQLFFIGMVGEYIGFIHTQILKRPLVTEKERVNFENDERHETYETHI